MAHQAHLVGHQSQAETMFTFTAISFTAPTRGCLGSRMMCMCLEKPVFWHVWKGGKYSTWTWKGWVRYITQVKTRARRIFFNQFSESPNIFLAHLHFLVLEGWGSRIQWWNVGSVGVVQTRWFEGSVRGALGTRWWLEIWVGLQWWDTPDGGGLPLLQLTVKRSLHHLHPGKKCEHWMSSTGVDEMQPRHSKLERPSAAHSLVWGQITSDWQY